MDKYNNLGLDEYEHLDIDESVVGRLKEGYAYPDLNLIGSFGKPPIHPLELMYQSLQGGSLPPIYVLLEIANTYAKYMDAEGAMSLEEAFFGELKRGVGNYSARRAKSKDLRLLNFELSIEEAFSEKGERRSQIEIVEEYLERQGRHDEDPEHVLRRIRRFRSKS